MATDKPKCDHVIRDTVHKIEHRCTLPVDHIEYGIQQHSYTISMVDGETGFSFAATIKWRDWRQGATPES